MYNIRTKLGVEFESYFEVRTKWHQISPLPLPLNSSHVKIIDWPLSCLDTVLDNVNLMRNVLENYPPSLSPSTVKLLISIEHFSSVFDDGGRAVGDFIVVLVDGVRMRFSWLKLRFYRLVPFNIFCRETLTSNSIIKCLFKDLVGRVSSLSITNYARGYWWVNNKCIISITWLVWPRYIHHMHNGEITLACHWVARVPL